MGFWRVKRKNVEKRDNLSQSLSAVGVLEGPLFLFLFFFTNFRGSWRRAKEARAR
jgi:hypothetical protein